MDRLGSKSTRDFTANWSECFEVMQTGLAENGSLWVNLGDTRIEW